MTTTAGQVAVKLNLDKKQFEQGMTEAKKSVDLLSTAFSSIAALGVGATLLNVGKSALKASSDYEQAQVQFGVMLNSAEKAEKLVGKLQNMANVTPFETQDLLNASKTLLNFNIALEDVMPDLQMLGDIAGGDRQRMQSLTLAFAQMSSAGRLMGQDLLQMINAGFNPLQQISEETDKSIGELKKEMEEGKISVEMVTQAFRNAASEGGRFYGMMDKQSQTLEGVMSTMSDAYTLMTRSISDLALPAIKAQVKETTKLIEKTTENINSLKEWAAVNQSTVYGLQNFAIALTATITGSVALAKVSQQVAAAHKAATAAIEAEISAQTALAYSKKVLAAEEAGLYQATLAYNAALATQDKQLIASAAANLQEAKAVHANAATQFEAATATAASRKATAAQYLMMGNFSKAIKVATMEVRAFTIALLENPITWVTVALAAGAAAWWKYQQAIHETENAVKELNAAQDENVNKTTDAIKTIQELQGVKKLDYDQTKRLDEAISYLTEKYPKYIGRLREELKLKGEISKATAEQIANELTLAKVKELTEKKQKIDKKVNNAVKGYKQQQLINAARFGTPINFEDTGRKGASKALQRDQDLVNKELEKVKKEREAIINELTALNSEASEVSTKRTSSTASDGKKKTEKQLAAEEKARQKEALDYKIALLEVEKYQTEKNADEIYQLNLKQAEARIAAAKAGTAEYAQALAEKLQLEREYDKKQKAMKSQQLVDDLTDAKQQLDNELANIEIAYESHKISKTKMLQAEIAYINKKKDLEAAALAEQLKLVEGNAAEEVKIKRAAAKTMEEYNIQANRKAVELANYQKEAFAGVFDDISSGWGSTITDLLNGEASFTDAINSMLDTVLNSFGNMCGELVQKWLADHMTMETITQGFTAVKLWCDNLLGISTEKRLKENTALVASEVATSGATAASAATTSTAMTGLAGAVNFVTNPIMKLADAMAALAVSSGAVALSMPIIAISTAITAASAALAAFSLGMMNATMTLTSGVAMMFAPVSMMLAAEMGIVAAAANVAAKAVASLAISLAAASAAAIPFVGWVLAPAAAAATGAAIAAADSLVQFREKGGTVKKGQPYIVGEKRPELFIPDRNGRIEPNTNSLNNAGGTTHNTYITTMPIQAIDTKDFKQRVGDLTSYIHGNIQSGVKKRQLAPLGGSQ